MKKTDFHVRNIDPVISFGAVVVVVVW